MSGFDGLFLMKWYTPKIMGYIFAVMANDTSRVIRRHVARNACESLALLATIAEIKHANKETEALLIEEDGSTPDKIKEGKKSEIDLVIRSLRKDKEVGKNDALRECLIPVLVYVRSVPVFTSSNDSLFPAIQEQTAKFVGVF